MMPNRKFSPNSRRNYRITSGQVSCTLNSNTIQSEDEAGVQRHWLQEENNSIKIGIGG